jgi:hypothetical protein
MAGELWRPDFSWFFWLEDVRVFSGTGKVTCRSRNEATKTWWNAVRVMGRWKSPLWAI